MIRPLTREDLAEYLRMRKSLWPDCSDEMHRLEMDAQFNSPTSPVFAHQRDNTRLGGFIELSIRARVDGCTSDKVAYIEGWYVDPDLRYRGIGRSLVLAAENWARTQGLTEIASDAELWNDRSIAAHAKLGFKETFRLVHFLKKL
jgi:aminoglycoside 6'-N-acetyltransferase I